VFNEFIFLLHILVVSFFLILSFYLGKNFLFAFVCLQGVLANLFVLKQIYLFGFEVTSGDVFIVGSMVGINLLQEFYDSKTANGAILGSFLFMIVFLIMSIFQLAYTPSFHDVTNASYLDILKFAPRLIGASLVSFLIVQLLELKLYVFLQNFFKRKFFFLRNGFALILFQFLDTIIFSFLGLAGIVFDLKAIIFVSFAIKLLSIFIFCPIIIFFLRFFKK